MRVLLIEDQLYIFLVIATCALIIFSVQNFKIYQLTVYKKFPLSFVDRVLNGFNYT